MKTIIKTKLFGDISNTVFLAILAILTIASIGTYLILTSKAATSLSADFTGDGIVNVFDLSKLATNWGKTGVTHDMGDANGDGIVNVFDLSKLAGEWGQSITPAGAPAHPHILFSASKVAELRAAKTTTHTDIWNRMLAEAASYPSTPPATPSSDPRSYGEYLLNIALIKLLDPSAAPAAKFRTYFFTMLNYPQWGNGTANPTFGEPDLTISHYLTALTISYDWHYNEFTDAERSDIVGKLSQRAVYWSTHSQYTNTYDKDPAHWSTWSMAYRNHYWINNFGIASVAYGLVGEMSETDRQAILTRTDKNLDWILWRLEDDGSSHEGPQYHEYGLHNLAMWIDMREQKLGGDSTQANPWFQESLYYLLYSLTPGGTRGFSGGWNGQADTQIGKTARPGLTAYWLAKRFTSGTAQWLAKQWPTGKVTSRDASAYLWYEPAVSTSSVYNLPTWHFFSKMGIFAWRSSWDNQASYFNLESGTTVSNHDHPNEGNFIIHGWGAAYIANLGYSYYKETEDANTLMISANGPDSTGLFPDGSGQYGEHGAWMALGSVDPSRWAHSDLYIADEHYFDVIADPTKMYKDTTLSRWNRETVGIEPNIFIVHDEINLTAAKQLDLLMHSFKVKLPATDNDTVDYRTYRLDNPWNGSNRDWQIQPSADNANLLPILYVADRSYQNWTTKNEPTNFVPEVNYATGSSNSTQLRFQLGWNLRRYINSANARSTVAFWFDTAGTLTADSWSDAQHEAIRLHRGTADTAIIIWPAATNAPAINGYQVVGAMGGRNIEKPAYFGRGISKLVINGVTFAQTNSGTVDFFARLEHAATSSEPRFVKTNTLTATTLTLRCPTQPASVKIDGATTNFTWAASNLTLQVPSGSHRFELQ